jgi:cytochrome c-type biogenesis protein CcmH
MLLWVAMAVMTGLAVLAVLWPLARRSAAAAAPEGGDVAMYRDQLREVERDRVRGVLAAAEAEAARAEVGRRLLAASERSRVAAPARANPVRTQAVTFAVLLGIPALALGTYLALGSPELPGQPLAARMQTNPENESGASLIARAEAELQRNPDNGAGWEVMAPVYMRLGRYADAVRAYGNAIRLSGSTADRESMHAIAQVAAADGVVTAQARGAIDRALALDPKHLQGRISRALALEQDGDRAGAAGVLKTVLADAPPGAPWAPGLKREIARLDGAPPRGPTAEQVDAAQSMSEGDRTTMIRGMVEGLAARLASEGGGIDDWLKLVRSYKVIGETEKARQAAAQARERYAKDGEALAKINSLVQSLGLGS